MREFVDDLLDLEHVAHNATSLATLPDALSPCTLRVIEGLAGDWASAG